MKKFILFFFLILIVNYAATAQNWTIGPFVKSKANPVISPDSSFKFYDPIKKDSVQWQKEYFVNLAWSDNLYEWNPIEENNELKHVMDPRPGKFDSRLTECGPPAIITKNRILLLYNGKNAADSIADFSLPKVYIQSGRLYSILMILEGFWIERILVFLSQLDLTKFQYSMLQELHSRKVWYILKNIGSYTTEWQIHLWDWRLPANKC